MFLGGGVRGRGAGQGVLLQEVGSTVSGGRYRLVMGSVSE